MLASVLLASTTAVYGETVNCNNNAGDAALIQGALNSAGGVTIAGTCNIGRSSLSILSNTNIQGSGSNGNTNGRGATTNTVINYSGPSWAFTMGGNNITINGLTINGGGLGLFGGYAGPYPKTNTGGYRFTNNTIQNITGYDSNAIYVDHVLTYDGTNANTISNNIFRNIWAVSGGFPNYPPGKNSGNCGSECIRGGGIQVAGGMTNITIDNNLFDKIGDDAINYHFGDLASAAHPEYYFLTAHIQISNNEFTNLHRYAIETQGAGDFYTGCLGGQCRVVLTTTGEVIKGNYWHKPFDEFNTIVYSIVQFGKDEQIYNNTAMMDTATCYLRPGIGFENSQIGTSLFQGNIVGSTTTNCNPPGFASYITQTYSNYLVPVSTTTFNNNLFCGPGVIANYIPSENGDRGNRNVEVGDYWATSCPSLGSKISMKFNSANDQSFAEAGTGTWSVSVVSGLSIRRVQFFVDGASTPVVTQELQDVNPNFAADREWRYHATLQTSPIGGGSHTITAKATDVSGATQSAAQTFVVGGVDTPVARVSPAAVAFGSQTLALTASAQTATLSNSGTRALAVSGLGITGSNASDFSSISTCGSSLAAGTTCAISITFTPSAAGSRTAALSISDNASGSPHTVSLSGAGVAPPVLPPPSTSMKLPNNLPTGMILWLANDAGVRTGGNGLVAWDDQSGSGNSAVQASAASQPVLAAGNNGQNSVRFNGTSSFMSLLSLPINGATGLSVFLVSANAKNHAAGYGQFAFLYWPETASWGSSFFGSYQTFSRFRFGTLQTGNEPSYQMPLTRTNSFGLSEWMHSGTTDSMWLNGQSVASYPGKQQSINGVGTSALLGQGMNNTFYAGDVSELIVYSRSLTASERQAIEQYLMNKYHL